MLLKSFLSTFLMFSCAISFYLAAMDRPLANPHSSHPLFERAEGYWSKPKDELLEGYFTKLTEPQSQRENWYGVCPYIAEFWCALSNAGFLYAGIKHKCPELIFAGTASALSHTIPKQWLLHLDKIGVALVLSKVIRERKALAQHPWLLTLVGAAGAINLLDTYLARNKGVTWPHVLWHVSSAILADQFLKCTKK